MRLRYRIMEGDWFIGRSQQAAAPEWPAGAFAAVLRAGGEWTVVCAAAQRPAGCEGDADWALLELDGPFDFGQTGVLAAWTAPLPAAQVPLMALASWATDYLLVRRHDLPAAMAAWDAAGMPCLNAAPLLPDPA